MKKSCINSFDIFCIFVLFSILFAIGTHIGKPRYIASEDRIFISVEIEKSKGDISQCSDILIDGKIKTEDCFFEENILYLEALCKITEAGYFLCGGKYISINQPIKLFWQEGYMEGRISDISSYKHNQYLQIS